MTVLPANRLVTNVVHQADLRKTLELIVDDPSSWDQEQWISRSPVCGTAGCLAGTYAVRVLGAEPKFFMSADRTATMVQLGDRLRFVEDVATQGLGLPNEHHLFAARNSLRRLVELAWLYTGGAVDLLDRYHELVADRGEEFAATERATEQLHVSVTRDYYYCQMMNSRMLGYGDPV